LKLRVLLPQGLIFLKQSDLDLMLNHQGRRQAGNDYGGSDQSFLNRGHGDGFGGGCRGEDGCSGKGGSG